MCDLDAYLGCVTWMCDLDVCRPSVVLLLCVPYQCSTITCAWVKYTVWVKYIDLPAVPRDSKSVQQAAVEGR